MQNVYKDKIARNVHEYKFFPFGEGGLVLATEKHLVLTTRKCNEIVGYIYAAPKMMSTAFSSEIIKKSFVDCGILDVITNTCPDPYAIINLFSISWSKIQEGKQWF